MNRSKLFNPVADHAGPVDPRVVAQAAEWIVRLQCDASDTARQRCDDWRAADPSHELAWQRLAALGRDLHHSGTQVAAPLAIATLEQARADERPTRRDTLKWLLGLGATATVAWYGHDELADAAPWQRWTADVRTGTGERHALTLADGTRLVLNTRSAVDIRIDARQRSIVLHAGEIMVSTAADPHGRPFSVTTPHGRVLPIGTRFTVRRLDEPGHPIQVAVFEGAVDLEPGGRTDGRTPAPLRQRLLAGQQARFTHAAASAPHTSHDGDGAWTEGMLIANRMPLEHFIAEVARYRTGLLRCHPGVGDLQVTGAFPLDDSDRILAMLEQVLPVRVQYRTRYWVMVVKA